MQSPRSPLDWEGWSHSECSEEPEHASQRMPTEEETRVMCALHELQEELFALRRGMRFDRRAAARHARRGLLGGLLHALDVVLLDVAMVFLGSPASRLW